MKSHKLPLGIYAAIALLFSVLSGTVGCSRDNVVYSDPAPPAVVVPVSTSPRVLPINFYNQSVNQASADLQLDGVTATSKAIRLQTSTGTNTAGGFNGSGIGNRAILGVGHWHARPLPQANTVSFDARNFAGPLTVGVSLQIDLKCDGSSLRVVNADPGLLAASATDVGDSYKRHTADQALAIWRATGADILDPDTSAVLVPSTGSATSLSALLAKFPAACLKNGITKTPAAADLPLEIPTAAIQFTLGTDSTAATNSTYLRRFQIGSEVLEDLQ